MKRTFHGVISCRVFFLEERQPDEEAEDPLVVVAVLGNGNRQIEFHGYRAEDIQREPDPGPDRRPPGGQPQIFLHRPHIQEEHAADRFGIERE